jgi:hypothetical protein
MGRGLAPCPAAKAGAAVRVDRYRCRNLCGLKTVSVGVRLDVGRACGLCNVSDMISPRRRVATVAKALRESRWETLHARPICGAHLSRRGASSDECLVTRRALPGPVRRSWRRVGCRATLGMRASRLAPGSERR